MRILLTALIFSAHVAHAQCDSWEPDFDRAIERMIVSVQSHHRQPAFSVVTGTVVSVGRKDVSRSISEMEMKVESVAYGSYRGSTLKLTRGWRAEFADFAKVKPGARYKVAFFAEDDGNYVPYCGVYFKKL